MIGKSRLALSGGCKEVGLYLSGCPLLSIFQADRWLEETLQVEGALRYLGGREVIKIQGDTLTGILRASGKPFELIAQKFFLAAGPLGSATIVFESLGLQELELPLAYHPYALTPLLFFKIFGGTPRERRHTLPQLFMESWIRTVSAHPIHNALSTYNLYVKDTLLSLLARLKLAKLNPLVLRIFVGRLGAVQSYLHSEEGGSIRMFFTRQPTGSLLQLASPSHIRISRKFGTFFLKSFRHFLRLGALPLFFMSKVGKPGDGNHIGACFPMSKSPREWQTNTLGQLKGMQTVHIVDASVLPDLPAQTITFTIMANAYRIGSICSIE